MASRDGNVPQREEEDGTSGRDEEEDLEDSSRQGEAPVDQDSQATRRSLLHTSISELRLERT